MFLMTGLYSEKKEKEKRNKLNLTTKETIKMDNAQEVFLMVNENQSAEEIMDLNDPMAKARFRK